jgi:hypothetical protein
MNCETHVKGFEEGRPMGLEEMTGVGISEAVLAM